MIFEYIQVGKLNIEILGKIGIQLITDEVILTFERLSHVEDRRKNLYEDIKDILLKAVYNPDYIYKDWNNRENTFVFIKNINKNSKLNIIIKIAKLNDEKHSKNSIITMIKVGNKTFNKINKNKSSYLLYEKLDKIE